MQGGASLCTSFCKRKRAVGKVKCRETVAARQLSSRWAPVQSTGNHQMKYQPEIVIKPHGNAFADSPQFTHGMTFYIRDWWLRGAKQKDACNSYMLKRPTDNARFESTNISTTIG